MDLSWVQWGTAPAWAAFGAAAIAASLAYGAYRREGRRDRINQLVRLRVQAEKVGAWQTMRGSDAVAFKLINTSDLPVRKVKIQVTATPPSSPGSTAPKSPEGTPYEIETLDAGKTEYPIVNFYNDNIEDEWPLIEECLFTDAQGIRWVRKNGRLDPVADPKEQPDWWNELSKVLGKPTKRPV